MKEIRGLGPDTARTLGGRLSRVAHWKGATSIVTTRSEIAYETAEKSLADQRQLVTDLRGRVATLLSAAAIVASFLGAQAFNGSPTTATTSTTTATTPETTTETTHGSTTRTSPESAWQRTETTRGTVTKTARRTATATTHGVTTTRPTNTASAGIDLNIWGWLALGSFVLLAILCLTILWPWEWSGWHTNAKVLVQGYVDPPDKTVESMQRDLALYHERHYKPNEWKLNMLYLCFRVASGLLVAQVVLWIVDLEVR